MSNKSDKKNYIVTGANSGIGYMCAEALLEQGNRIIGIDYHDENMKQLQLRFKDSFSFAIKDLSQDIDKLPDFITELKNQFGCFSGMVCCAGISNIQPLRALDFAILQKMMAINFYAPLFLAKGFCKKENNCGTLSSIVLIASAAAVKNDKGQISYSASKAAASAAFRCLAREVSSSKIRVNIISPVDVKTPMMEELNKYRNFDPNRYPLGVMEPKDVVDFILFLLSDKTTKISCQNYILDCGVL